MHPLLFEEKSPSTTNCMLIKPGITGIWQIPCRFDLSREGVLTLGFMWTRPLIGSVVLLVRTTGAAITHEVCIDINTYIQDFGKSVRG